MHVRSLKISDTAGYFNVFSVFGAGDKYILCGETFVRYSYTCWSRDGEYADECMWVCNNKWVE
jgi:hypothetical protein